MLRLVFFTFTHKTKSTRKNNKDKGNNFKRILLDSI